MVRITQDFLNHLSPVELSFIRTGIDKLYKEKTRHLHMKAVLNQ